MVEHRLAKARVASSNLVSRFLFRERVKKKRNLCLTLLFLYEILIYKKTKIVGIFFVNCTPFVRQYDILNNKWGDFYAKRSTK